MKTVFFDVDTQLDFVYPAGSLYVPGAERIIPAIAHLNRFAAQRGIPVISSVDAHTENDPEFKSWPAHCIAGTNGQHKAELTLIEKRVIVPNRPVDISLEGAQQIILEKQTTDAFLVPNLAKVLDLLAADHFVVYGVVTEVCVLFAARGLLKAGKEVMIVTDAVQGLTNEAADRASAEICAAGGSLTTVNNLIVV